MAATNTLTNLLPDMYEALDQVSRELTGFIPAVSRSSGIARAAMGQTVRIPVTGEAQGGSNTPGTNVPDDGGEAIDNVEIAITKSEYRSVRWGGEDTLGLTNAGTFSSLQAARFYQGMRSLVNEIEADLWAEAYKNASRGYVATAGTTPFGTAGDLTDFAGVLRILEENGAPRDDLQLVLGHAAMGNLRGKQTILSKVNEAGSSDMLRNGMTDRIMNMAIRHSDAVGIHVAGTGTGYDINNGPGHADGSTSIILHDGTEGATGIKAGDLVTFDGDTNKYNVITGTAAAAGTIVIGKPGLRKAAANTTEMSIVASHERNVAFARSAIVLATRLPAQPPGGDMATDTVTLVDDRTGIAFEVARYPGFHQTTAHVRLAWGFRAIKQQHIAVL